MPDRIEIKPDESLTRKIWEMYGIATVLEALGGDKPKSTLPGFALALALVEKESAECRAHLSGAVYRCAAKAGHNIAEVASIHTNLKNGEPVVEIELMDLVDKAKS